MSVSMLTALEIFSNPFDLVFVIGERNGKWGFSICRGPEHRYKLMLSTDYFADSRQAAIDAIADILTRVCQAGTQEFSDSDSAAGAIFNPTGLPIDDAESLSGQLREQILEGLKTQGEVHTARYRNATEAKP